MQVQVDELRSYLQAFDFQSLLVEGLGWNYYHTEPVSVYVDGHDYTLDAAAEKANFVVYICGPDAEGSIPPYPVRRKIERQVTKLAFEHLIVFADAGKTLQIWQWVKREAGKPAACREQEYRAGQTGAPILQRLQTIAFALEEEEGLNILQVASRVQKALDVERVTRRFYESFKIELTVFQKFIDGIIAQGDREWYASLMLNRMMFVYFVQKQGFLDGDPDYLRSCLSQVQSKRGSGQFQQFYRDFLLKLFHEGLGQPESKRDPELAELLGQIPFLNGGLFDVHNLERDNPEISIPDEAFERVFNFFDGYRWHLDERSRRDDNEINPDVLGYIFEKYVNQKQMGAYYTKEDITGYITRNTVIPFLFDAARKECPVAFNPGSGVWHLLQDDPNRYIYPSVGHGLAWAYSPDAATVRLEQALELPEDIAAGLDDVSRRGGWNRPAPAEYALPTETWREVVARRRHYQEVRDKLAGGEVSEVNDLITLNLDAEQFALNVIVQSEGPELLRAFWHALRDVSVLDPTCGSGAFLFAALNILEPLYTACLEGMRGFLDDLERTERPHHPQAMSDFRAVLEQADRHPSQRYFILKSIVLNNLYGVDIMEEAVEICKLRLFLKLVAQLESYEQIEPLPDIDFNIRAGNTLVGFTSLADVERAMTISATIEPIRLPGRRRPVAGQQFRALDEEQRKTLERIEEDAEIASRAFNQFREQQTALGEEVTPGDKAALRSRFNSLREELDRYMAAEYGVTVKDSKTYDRWRSSHQPFHWFVEFYGIMNKGGFDVVVGNPPYVSTKSIEYALANEDTGSFPDIYGHVATRSRSIRSKHGKSGLIVPLSLVFSQDFSLLRDHIAKEGTHWCSSFDNIPAPLFSGTSQRCTIWISGTNSNQLFTTRLIRWRSAHRPCLIDNISYVRVSDKLRIKDFGIPRLSLAEWGKFLELPTRPNNVQPNFRGRDNGSEFKLSYSTVARNFLSTYLEPPPVIETDGRQTESAQSSSIALTSEDGAFTALASTSGDACFWYWLTRADGFHVTNWLLTDFLASLDSFHENQIRLLSNVGKLLHRYRFAALVFKKNAGKFVGNYNYQKLMPLTRRADLLYFSGLGATFTEAKEILAFVAQVRSINEAAGERGIPEDLKNQFRPPDVRSLLTDKGLWEVNEQLCMLFGVDQTQLDSVLHA